MNENLQKDLKIICDEDCGNAPKKLFLREFILAWVKNNLTFIEKNISESVCWNIIGDRSVQGKTNFLDTYKQIQTYFVKEIEISTIITHGKTGAINGNFTYEQGKIDFCHVLTFTSAGRNGKIKKLTTYEIIN
ncbi:nuclear transport factor 2 family protein [Sporosalibacterium faouarense]|uniref:nuclear transport factor 2 family protein n=1 Tax=Sporosalibacterium faouarense TaxID=516123 RepID=UPI00141D3DD4|nr:hypothetical protein [Sporosalibacterium faouarense]MTI48081.1 hypothetical protein [Bacillota bacterium]